MKWATFLAAAIAAGCLVAVPGCKLSAFATPEENLQLVEGDVALDHLTEADKQAIQAVLGSLERLNEALMSGEPETLSTALAEASDAMERSEMTGKALDSALRQYGELEAGIRKRAAETAGTWILPGLPPPLNGPLGIIAIQGALLLGFDRSRKHLASAASAAARAKLMEAIRSAGKALGLMHTEPTDPASGEKPRV